MDWVKLLKDIVSLGQSLYVFKDPCVCGSRDIRVESTESITRRRSHLVYCVDCHIRTPWYATKRRAKRAWNLDMRDKTRGCNK